ILNISWKVLTQMTYSPDSSLTDFSLFRSLQHHQYATHFNTIEKKVKRWTKFMENIGDYFDD
ncbi:hypothetical protein WH47_03111, partial [Habropoda laboriosa]